MSDFLLHGVTDHVAEGGSGVHGPLPGQIGRGSNTAHEVAYQAERQQRQLRLAEPKTAPGGKNATRRIKGWRLGVD